MKIVIMHFTLNIFTSFLLSLRQNSFTKLPHIHDIRYILANIESHIFSYILIILYPKQNRKQEQMPKNMKYSKSHIIRKKNRKMYCIV